MQHYSRFSITMPGASEMGDSFETRKADHVVTAKRLVEISGSPALVSTTGLLQFYH